MRLNILTRYLSVNVVFSALVLGTGPGCDLEELSSHLDGPSGDTDTITDLSRDTNDAGVVDAPADAPLSDGPSHPCGDTSCSAAQTCTVDGTCQPRGWATISSPTGHDLYGIWGSSATDIWAVGYSGEAVHYDGATWTSSQPTLITLRGIWGSSASDIWAVGYFGTVIHYDGAAWAKPTPPTSHNLWGIWGSSASNIWTVGFNGTVMHYDGSQWIKSTSPTSHELYAIHGCSASDVWAVGKFGTVIHFNGSGWAEVSSAPTYGNLTAVWCSPSGDVWIGGESVIFSRNSAGGAWVEHTDKPISTIFGIRGLSATDIWAVGGASSTLILYHDGKTWTPAVNGAPNKVLYAVWGDSLANQWAVGESGMIVKLQ
jgi:hypothetical protein